MDALLLGLRIILALMLYAFLAAVVVVLVRDLRRSAAPRPSARLSGRLIVVQSSDESMGPGTIFPLLPVTSIGRAPDNTVAISDTFASAHHALVTWRGGQWWVEDHDSRNGTLLNDTLVANPTVISAGDVIGIGGTQLKLELQEWTLDWQAE